VYPLTSFDQDCQVRKILILTAIPQGLRLDVEVREIEEAIRRALQRERFSIRVRTAVRPEDIRRVIAEEKPYIVHFCGHGLENGNLMLEDSNGHPKTVTPSALTLLFELHARYVHCVLLNACHSEKTAEAISKHIRYVIGMNQAITDKSAVKFSQGFYDALGYENQDAFQAIERAFQEGKVAIALEESSEIQTPVLKRKFLQVPKAIVFEENSEIQTPVLICKSPEEPEVPPSVPVQPLKGAYVQLRQYLQAGQFKEADQETAKILLTLVGRLEEGWSRSHDIEQFPCPDFQILNRLWLNFSDGRFGFSVQRDVWLSLGAKSGEFSGQLFRRFGDCVGWRVNEDWLAYSKLNFSKSAPIGHLPSLKSSRANQSMNSLGIWQDNLKSFLALAEKYLSD